MNPVIPDKLFFKIGEVAQVAQVEQHVLRYWEEEFDTLKPEKNRAGQRLYKRKDVEMILEIKRLLYEEKFTIAGAKQKLREARKNGQTSPEEREKRLHLKQKIQQDLESILHILDKGSA